MPAADEHGGYPVVCRTRAGDDEVDGALLPREQRSRDKGLASLYLKGGRAFWAVISGGRSNGNNDGDERANVVQGPGVPRVCTFGCVQRGDERN